MVDSPGEGRDDAEGPRETDTTMHFSEEFASQLAAMQGELSAEE